MENTIDAIRPTSNVFNQNDQNHVASFATNFHASRMRYTIPVKA